MPPIKNMICNICKQEPSPIRLWSIVNVFIGTEFHICISCWNKEIGIEINKDEETFCMFCEKLEAELDINFIYKFPTEQMTREMNFTSCCAECWQERSGVDMSSFIVLR